MVRLGASAVLLVCLLQVTRAAILTTNDIKDPVTVPLMPGMRSRSAYLDINDPLLPGSFAVGDEPTQVHLAPAGPGSVNVMWATGQAKTGQGALQRNDPKATPSVVYYGTNPDNLTLSAFGTAEVYDQIYNLTFAAIGGDTVKNYTSPVLHTVVLSNLTPTTRYYYKVSDGRGNDSAVYSFKSPAAPGAASYPQRILLLADWGMSANATSTLQHVLRSAQTPSSPVIFYIADFCYADTWFANGTASNPSTGFEGRQSGTWQPVWDAWQRFIEPLVSQVPMLGCTGNHEIEQQSDASNTVFASVQARWKVPSASSNSPSYFFHSYEFGPVHAISLSPYVDYTVGSAQYNWLVQDLQKVNRTKTPWVTVDIHNPWVTTDSSYKQFEQMRVAMEPVTYKYGVDIFFYGHVHSYERTTPVYNYTVDPCGAVHLTIGDAGNSEGLSGVDANGNPRYEDINGGCPNVTASTRASFLQPVDPSINDPWKYFQQTLTFFSDGNSTGVGNPPGYCDKQQPKWSAYREPSFGHGVLDVLNSTHALWQWHRNQDAVAVVADEIYIVRNVDKCPMKLGNQ